MSYILDALRRADAERQRGSVPGLNTPGAALPAADPAAAHGRRPLWLAVGVVAAAALVGLGALALSVWRPAEAPRAAAVSAALPAPAVAPAPAAAQPVVVALPSVAPPVVVVMPAPLAASAPTVPAPVVAAPGVTPAPAAARATAAVPERVPALAELPEALRRLVPALALGGSVYSEQPAQRLVIVNGQVAHEGDEAAPGVRVIQIRPKTVVFGVGGQRFEAAL